MPESTYLEVRCERCKTSFAPGTKQCLHCGGAIGRRLLSLDALTARDAGAGPGEPASARPDAQPDLGRFIRFALITLAILAALARVFLNDR